MPNPIVVPLYAEPLVWAVAGVSMLAEIATWCAVMRRLGFDSAGLGARLAAINLATWVPFLIAVDQCDRLSPSALSTVIAAMEVAIVVVEAALLLVVSRGFARWPALPCARVRFGPAVLASFAGNVVSVLISLGVPLLLAAIS